MREKKPHLYSREGGKKKKRRGERGIPGGGGDKGEASFSALLRICQTKRKVVFLSLGRKKKRKGRIFKEKGETTTTYYEKRGDMKGKLVLSFLGRRKKKRTNKKKENIRHHSRRGSVFLYQSHFTGREKGEKKRRPPLRSKYNGDLFEVEEGVDRRGEGRGVYSHPTLRKGGRS